MIMTDLVVVSLERWDEIWRRNQHLVSGLLAADADLRVLFVEPPDDPLHGLSTGARATFGHRVTRAKDVERLWTHRPVKWFPRRIVGRADELIARGIRRAANKIGMKSPLVWINDPGAAAVSELTGWPTLYDMTDDWVVADRPRREIDRMVAGEQYLLAHAAEVVACSPELAQRKRPFRSDITLIRNAVDVAAYRTPVRRPTDLPPESTAVYVGTLHRDRLDVDLCIETAIRLGDEATLVLVGPNLLGEQASARLHEAGVRVLGPRSRDAVIGYLQHADVLVVPHVVSSFTDSLDPIKLYEYQAVGRPVVATPVAGFRDAEDPRIAIAAGEGFSQAVHARAIAKRSPDDVSAVVPDWTSRVSDIAAVVARAQSGHQGE
jgi:teichuronic acid biosynthesis glycosyltransferase TuaH